MTDFYNIKNDFLQQLILKIEKNLSDELFGVSELAAEVNMSRSNLLRKVKSITSLSASQFIRQIRLQKAKEFLKDDSHNISEVAFKVGFNSTSYFIKCFKDEFGYPPGEFGKMEEEHETIDEPQEVTKKMPALVWAMGIGIVLALTVFFVIRYQANSSKLQLQEKSIAVLPFKNDSNDSTNVYVINGLMEAILSHLQKIENLRVISRTSVEQYRYETKTIGEIAEELDVKYFVEGSGQKIGDQILLTVQLIEAPEDKHIWAEQYARQTGDIFKLQTEVAKNIANQIEVIITPDVIKRINKVPTEDLVAYDYYLKGLEYSKIKNYDALFKAIKEFKKAITRDENFANAYAYVAICYYYLDLYQTNKKYRQEINTYADKALLLDAELPESLIAKGLFYMHSKDYELAVEFLDKVLVYNPNSGWVNNFLADVYNSYLPDTEKYLKHALKASRLNMRAQDSVTASFLYLHLANALVQSGFLDESKLNIKKSLAYNPDNLFSQYVYAYILYTKNRDIAYTKKLLIQTLEKDTTRLDVLQEVAKMCYYNGDYDESMKYFDKFIMRQQKLGMNIFPHMNSIIAHVMEIQGRDEESKAYFAEFKKFAEEDKSIYRGLHLAIYYSHHGELDKAITYLKTFSEMHKYQYWLVMSLKDEPLLKNLKNHPEFDDIIKKIDTKFWEEHEETKIMLQQEGLI